MATKMASNNEEPEEEKPDNSEIMTQLASGIMGSLDRLSSAIETPKEVIYMNDDPTMPIMGMK